MNNESPTAYLGFLMKGETRNLIGVAQLSASLVKLTHFFGSKIISSKLNSQVYRHRLFDFACGWAVIIQISN